MKMTGKRAGGGRTVKVVEGNQIILPSGTGWVRMKGTFRITSLGFALFLGYCCMLPCTRADTIYLSTYNLNTIVEFDSSGSQSAFATASSGLNYPLGLAFDSSGNLYVANTFNIEEFNSSGTGSIFATSASGVSLPTALAFDKSGNLFVANSGNNTLVKINPSGTGSVFATAATGLDDPVGLAFDTNGNLYVANHNNTILEFTPSGTGTVFATSGVHNPQGLAFDSSGNLYVANGGNNTIEEFNSFGQGSVFTSTNLLSQAIGLAFDSSGNLYAADEGNGSIVEFNSSGIGSVFASGLGNAEYLADEVPEPSAFLLAALGGVSLIAFLKRKRT